MVLGWTFWALGVEGECKYCAVQPTNSCFTAKESAVINEQIKSGRGRLA